MKCGARRVVLFFFLALAVLVSLVMPGNLRGPFLLSAANEPMPAKPVIAPAPSRILFGSCLIASKPHPILEQVVKESPDLFIFTGDNIYADTQNMEVMARKYRELAASPRFQNLLEACPVLAVWDDHDYGLNDAGTEYPAKGDSRRLFLDFWRVPEDAPRRAHEGIYDVQFFGSPARRVQVILLDTRSFRSPLKKGNRLPTHARGPYVPSGDPDATILGPDQWAWLADQLKVPARIRLIVSSIQVLAEFHGWESWANFPGEKERLFRLISESGAGGVVILSGDRHFAEISKVEEPGLYPLYDITSSGLNVTFPTDTPSVNGNRVDGYYLKENFGMVEIDWERPDPLLHFRIFDGLGQVRIETGCALSVLVPKACSCS